MKSLVLFLLDKIRIDKEFAIKLLLEIVKDSNNEADAQALKEVTRKLL